MKHLTPIEISGFVVGIIFVLMGLYGAIWPQEIVVHHSVNGPRGAYFRTLGKNSSERVTEGRARFYGIMCVTLGVGIATAAAYRAKK